MRVSIRYSAGRSMPSWHHRSAARACWSQTMHPHLQQRDRTSSSPASDRVSDRSSLVHRIVRGGANDSFPMAHCVASQNAMHPKPAFADMYSILLLGQLASQNNLPEVTLIIVPASMSCNLARSGIARQSVHHWPLATMLP